MDKLACGTRGCWPIKVTTTVAPSVQPVTDLPEELYLTLNFGFVICGILLLLTVLTCCVCGKINTLSKSLNNQLEAIKTTSTSTVAEQSPA